MHAGERQPAPRQPAAVPIYQTAPFLFATAGELEEAFAGGRLEGLYSRYSNPTVRAAEEKLAALEGAEDAVAFASGMGAIAGTLQALLTSGDRLIAAAELYGGTHAWFGWLTRHHPEVGVERVPIARLAERLESEATDGVRAVYLETPANPLLACGDLERVGRACRARGLDLVVDNTFATPVLQNPLALGARLVVHSATKYLAGHDDLTAGLVAGDRELLGAVREVAILGGACLDPHAAFLLARGMKTLALRVERQSENAQRLARFLGGRREVARVFYPGLDPIGRRQMRAGGGMLSFELAGGGPAARGLLDRLELFQILPSLGGVESGVMLPAVTSHRQLSPEQRAEQGIADGLVRVSCGIEDGDDLEADLGRALSELEA